LAYVGHADWVLIGDLFCRGDEKTGTFYTRVYDCRRNRVALLDAGGFLGRRGVRWVSYSSGWMYDEKRRLVYAFTVLGEAWALRINPETARLIEHLPR
jgi:hypothetical protein